MSLEAVIFDLDGLLVDSEPLQFSAYRRAFATYGISFERADWPKWHALEASAAKWIETHGLDLDAEEVRAAKKAIYDDLVEKELALKPGARELIGALAGTYRLCVASGSRPESIDACLRKFALDSHFEWMVSAVTLPRKKPWPDVYLAALDRLQVPADSAVAIEDSVAGLKAATAAGLRCVVCPDTFVEKSRAAFAAAATIVDSLHEVDAAMLERIVSSHVAPTS